MSNAEKQREAGKTGRVSALLLVAAVSVFSPLSTYARNVNEITFLQFLPFGLGFLALGLLAYGFCRLVLRAGEKAALMAAWLMLVFSNFGFLTVFFPDLHENHKLYVICGLVCLLVSGLLCLVLHRLNGEITGVLCMTFAFAFSALVLLNAVLCSVNGLRGVRGTADPERETLVQAAQAAPLADRPNVYFMIFDEYAGFDELQSYYGFDNTAFYDRLSELGFTMARGCTNESIGTTYVLADVVNLQFLHQDEVSEDTLRYQIEHGVLFDVMDALGYTLYDTESERLTQLNNPIPELPSFSAPVTPTGGTYVKVFLYHTAAAFLYNDIENLLWGENVARYDLLNLVTDYYATMEKPKEPSFYFSYVCSPHGPFYFDADGNRIDTPDDPYNNYNWEDHSLYLGQLQYVNKRIEAAVSHIVEEDPDSIIILMSDHGSRYHEDGYDPALAAAERLDILAGVYYRGEPLEGLDGLDGINILRTVLRETYGMEIPVLDYWEDGHLTDTLGRRVLGLT